MHAIVATVNIDVSRSSKAVTELNDIVVPGAKATPGFIHGYWVRSSDQSKGTSVELFETQRQAEEALAARSGGPPPDSPVTIVSAEVMEVMASA